MWQQFVLWAVTSLISYALRPKPKPPEKTKFNDLQVPNSQEGQSLRVCFGSPDIKDAHVTWYGDFSLQGISKKSGKK